MEDIMAADITMADTRDADITDTDTNFVELRECSLTQSFPSRQ